MTIAVLAPARAPLRRRLEAALAALVPDLPVVTLDPELPPFSPCSVGGAGVSVGGVGLGAGDTVFVHGVGYEDPVLPPAEPDCDWSLWQAGAVIRQQRYSHLYSLLSRAEAVDGLRLYNPVSVLLRSFSRFDPLDRLGAVGFQVPPLLVTNDPDAATAFLATHTPALWRPVTGGAAWQLCQDRQRRHLVGTDRPPVLLAGVAQGPLLRAYVFDGQVVLTLMMAAPSREGLERFERFGVVTTADHIPGAERAGAAAAALRLRWGVLTYVATNAGPVFYDVDPDPVLTDLPPAIARFLIDALACGLAGHPLPAPPADLTGDREVLLLRRMLAIQFDIEATKYAPDRAGE